MAATLTVNKWGNSSGIRIPENVLNSLDMKNGDQFTYEVVHQTIVLKPIRHKKSTKELFEEFYHKPFSEITAEDLGEGSEIDWGEDIGSEVIE